MDKTTIKPVSNIAIKSKYDSNPYGYIPYDLLPKVYNDKRCYNYLSKYQKEQQYKKMFCASVIVDVDDNSNE